MRRTVFFILITLGCGPLCFGQRDAGSLRGSGLLAAKEGSLDGAAVNAFVDRVTGGRASSFVAEYLAASKGKDVFELESRKGKIVLRGSNGLSVGSALNYYLREYCHSLVTGNGIDLRLPAVLPVVKEKVRRETPYRYRYYLNYCTFNYSMAWWDWARWQREIDWMTLNGINLPLALTGEEAIWQEVYRRMGFTDAELSTFFVGPAYFSWFWMGNIDAWGGPLPQHWMDSHRELQKKILGAERSMGMKPVLASFTGHVPASFVSRFPGAKVKKTNWGAGFEDVYILDPSDPLFEKIGQQFIAAQTAEYGTDHFYSADTFNENVPPTDDSAYLSQMSKKVFASMAGADAKAIWVMQGWMFHYNAAYWKAPQIQALLKAVPDDQMIVLDLYSESHPVWNRTNSYYGKPWIWNMLQNFGGNVSMWGRMEAVGSGPAEVLKDNLKGRMEGIGLTPEGIEQNPALFQLMLENVWRDSAIDVPRWLRGYALQRYGRSDARVDTAWGILLKTVYAGGLGEGGPESIIVSRPMTEAWGERVRTKLDYEPAELVKAWGLFVQAADRLGGEGVRGNGGSDGFRYDLVDITRQVLANYALPLQQKWVLAYLQHDVAGYDRYTNEFLELMDDMDILLSTRKDFLLGRWIGDARRCGVDAAEKDLYEKNARDLITLWGDKESGLHEYSCRQWAGLIRDFYRPRWEQYFVYLRHKFVLGDRMETTDFEQSIKDWEWKWVNTNGVVYPEEPVGDAVEVVRRMYKKYAPRL
ncbi:MAG TPA: alpha-N-acetylglucosaminidase [Puia sp.]|nr:alpha-N-acetylglucosaminidase [Puia sp.]